MTHDEQCMKRKEFGTSGCYCGTEQASSANSDLLSCRAEMNVISELRQEVKKEGKAEIDIDKFNQLQKEWILRTMDKQAAMALATSFYRWWHNQPGTNTDQGFDEWWELQR